MGVSFRGVLTRSSWPCGLSTRHAVNSFTDTLLLPRPYCFCKKPNESGIGRCSIVNISERPLVFAPFNSLGLISSSGLVQQLEISKWMVSYKLFTEYI